MSTLLLVQRFAADPGQLMLMRYEAAHRALSAGADQRGVDNVRLAVSEAATHFIRLGEGEGDRELQMEVIEHPGHVLEVVICLHRSEPGAASVFEGLELRIIASCVSELSLERTREGSAAVAMRFELTRGRGEDRAAVERARLLRRKRQHVGHA